MIFMSMLALSTSVLTPQEGIFKVTDFMFHFKVYFVHHQHDCTA